MRLIILFVTLAASLLAQAPALPGRWDGTITLGDLKVPFLLQMVVDGAAVTGSFVTGDERVTSTKGRFSAGVLKLDFSAQGTHLEATLADGGMKGTYGGAAFGSHAVEASPYCTCGFEGEAGPDISGVWEVPGALPQRLEIRRKGEDTLASLQLEEGTSNSVIGRFDGLSFSLHRFDGTRGLVMEIEPRKDGTLDVTLKEPGQNAKEFRGLQKQTAGGK